jgi:hypothetical protein
LGREQNHFSISIGSGKLVPFWQLPKGMACAKVKQVDDSAFL